MCIPELGLMMRTDDENSTEHEMYSTNEQVKYREIREL